VLLLVYSCIPARQWTDICNTRCSILSRFSHFQRPLIALNQRSLMVMAAADFDALSCLLARDQMLYVSFHEKHFAGRGLCSQMTEFVCSRPRGYKAISTLCVVGVEDCATFPAVYLPQGSRTSPNTAERSVSGALEPKPEAEIWRRPVFLTRRPRLSICPKVGQSTLLLPVLPIHFRFDLDDFLHAFFRITVNFTTFRAISDTFVSISGF